jgi:hypothetical protein
MRAFFLAAASSLVGLTGPVHADEGMWMPQQIPMLGEELDAMGLQIDPSAFNDLTEFPMGAIVSLGGCSAAFVSDQGLIVTNHHCVFGALQYNSTPERDLIEEGFLARSWPEELPALPTARVYVTTEIEDVTDAIAGNVDAGISDQHRAKLIEDRRKAMIRECEGDDELRCQVSSFFAGEQFLKITSLKIKDVRLVYAPALGVGNFGDEEDNWMWPRHTGDFGFYRAYVGKDGRPAEYAQDNVPYRPKHHLKISTRDLDPGDLILVAGYPGRTSRLVTADEVRYAQEFQMPTSIAYRVELLDILHEKGESDRDIQILNASRIAGLENYLKKYRGTLEAFDRDGLLHEKMLSEKRLEEYFSTNPEKAAEYEAIREEFVTSLKGGWATRERDTLLEWLYTGSPMLAEANTLHRMSVERAKPDAERDEDYQERDWPRRLSGVRRAQRTIEPGTDRAGLRLFLLKCPQLPHDQRIEVVDDALAATGVDGAERQVDALLDRLYASTVMNDLDARLAMFEESAEELEERGDALIEFAAALRVLGEANEERDRAQDGLEYRLRPQLIAAMRDMRDGRLAPDANGTLRVGFGEVKGYTPRDGVYYEPQTTVDGVIAKSTGERPFDTPPQLLEMAKARRFGDYGDSELGTLAVGFITTVNVTNGSSGSSALNAWGEIAGLAFDMNWEGVAADWVVNEDYVRTINVDSRYMLWVMDAVDGAHNLLREMGLPVQFPAASASSAGAAQQN